MDLSIKNTRIYNYLENKTQVVPEEEMRYLLGHVGIENSFLDDLKHRLAGGIQVITKQGTDTTDLQNEITNHLFLLAQSSAWVLDKDTPEETKEQTVKEAAASLKALWNIFTKYRATKSL